MCLVSDAGTRWGLIGCWPTSSWQSGQVTFWGFFTVLHCSLAILSLLHLQRNHLVALYPECSWIVSQPRSAEVMTGRRVAASLCTLKRPRRTPQEENRTRAELQSWSLQRSLLMMLSRFHMKSRDCQVWSAPNSLFEDHAGWCEWDWYSMIFGVSTLLQTLLTALIFWYYQGTWRMTRLTTYANWLEPSTLGQQGLQFVLRTPLPWQQTWALPCSAPVNSWYIYRKM